MLDRAGPKYLDILEHVIYEVDELKLTPFYLLCERGYLKKFNKEDQISTGYRLSMIKLLFPREAPGHIWSHVCKQIKFTPMHWLAYWDDVESIRYILSNIDVNYKTLFSIMQVTETGLTPLDIAGKHKSNESAMALINFLTDNFSMIRDLFTNKNKKNKVNEQPIVIEFEDLRQQPTFQIEFVSVKQLT